MFAELLGFPSGELGPAVISRIGSKPGDYYENTYPRSDSLLTDVPCHSGALLCPARPSLHRNAGPSRVQRLPGTSAKPYIRDSPDRRVSGAGAGSSPTLAAETS